MIVTDIDGFKKGKVVLREQGILPLEEGDGVETLRNEQSPELGLRFNFWHVGPSGRPGWQMIVDRVYEMPAVERERVLNLYCPAKPSTSLSAHFGENGEELPKKLVVPDKGTAEEAWRIVRIFDSNVQSHQKADDKYSFALYPVLNRINHSCEPNVSIGLGADGRLELQAIKNLKEGDELLQSYLTAVELLWSRKDRQAKLLRGWGFTCDCPRCMLS